MNASRPTNNRRNSNAQQELAGWRKMAAGIMGFFFDPASPRSLAALRIGLAAVLLAQGFSLSLNWLDLYGSRGVVQWTVTDGAAGETVPRISWLVDSLKPLGLAEATVVRGLLAVYMASLAALLLGYRTRAAAITAWMAHLMMNTSATATVYGVDTFANIALFYCTWMPVGAALSADRAAGRTSDGPSAEARLAIRVLQMHLCIVYLATGVEKALGIDWWNGEAIWCSLMRADLCSFDMSWLARFPGLAMLAGWGTLLIEIGYAAFVWPSKTRRLWAAATIGLHLGIAIFLGLTSFAAIMSVFTFSAFMVSSEPFVAAPAVAEEEEKAAVGPTVALA